MYFLQLVWQDVLGLEQRQEDEEDEVSQELLLLQLLAWPAVVEV